MGWMFWKSRSARADAKTALASTIEKVTVALAKHDEEEALREVRAFLDEWDAWGTDAETILSWAFGLYRVEGPPTKEERRRT